MTPRTYSTGEPRTLLVSPGYPPPFVGGASVYIHNLARHFPLPLDIVTAPVDGEAPVDGPPAHRTRMLRAGSVADPSPVSLAAMYAYLAGRSIVSWRRDYDVVIANTGPIGNSILVMLLTRLGVTVVAMSYGEELTLALGSSGLKSALKRFIIRRALPRASGHVTISDFTKNVLCSLGIAPVNVRTVDVMVDDHLEEPLVAPARERALVVTAGRLIRRKGFDLLIAAVDRLKDGVPNLKLLIVGDGPERERLECEVATRGLNDRVEFAGTISDAALVDAYRRAAVFVLANVTLPDGDTEGAGIVLIEASKQGAPVIAGVAGGTAAVVADGVTGLLVDASDPQALDAALEQVLTDPRLARRLGEAGRARVKRRHDAQKNSRLFGQFVREIHDGTLRRRQDRG
jgi:phosphatidyl-myo-inositol dimannoside synthase